MNEDPLLYLKNDILPRMRRLTLLSVACTFVGCVEPMELPVVGECADVPEGTYEYGQIGIGSCIATPADVQFIEQGDDWVLAVSNANAFRDYDSGSVLFIDWNDIDLTVGKNLVSDLRTAAVSLPHFPGTIASVPERDLVVVPVRVSEESSTTSAADDVHLIDVSDVWNAAEVGLGVSESSTVEVEADPFVTLYDDDAGWVYVGNRTSHSVSIVDVLAEPIDVVAVGTDASVGPAHFSDRDGSGSMVETSVLTSYEDEEIELVDDFWTASYVDGTFRLWLPDASGLVRYTSAGDGVWDASAYGTELDAHTTDGAVGEVRDPFFYGDSSLGARMLFADNGAIRGGTPVDFLADWVFDEDPILEGNADAWDAELGGPSVIEDIEEELVWLFYDGTDGETLGIGAAISEDGLDFTRLQADPLVVAGGSHDVEGMADPYVIWDSVWSRWRMFYSAWDGSTWTIGHASSEDLVNWETEPEAIFALDGYDVAAPVVSAASGRPRMWYLRRASVRDAWEVAAATSVDGFAWDDQGAVLDIPDGGSYPGEDAPGVALQSQGQNLFTFEGLGAGDIGIGIAAGTTYDSETYGFSIRIAAGHQVGRGSAGSDSRNGRAVSAWIPGTDWALFDLVDSESAPSIGFGTWDGDVLEADEAAVFTAGDAGSFDENGVSAPALALADDGSYVMFYTGWSDGIGRLGRATSVDGETWTRSGSSVLSDGEDWDAIAVEAGSVERFDDGTWRVWYAGFDGEEYRIGAATSPDGLVFTRLEGSEDAWLFEAASPGTWEDSGVRDPFVFSDGETTHAMYAGFDGETWRLGYATIDANLEFTRTTDVDGVNRSVLSGQSGLFDYDGVRRPVAGWDGDGWVVHYHGMDDAIFRSGVARGRSLDVLYKDALWPTSGDTLTFYSVHGDEDAVAISLDTEVDGYEISTRGMTSMHLDVERGYLLVSSKLLSYIVVIDVRDDTTTGVPDTNYLGVEAILTVETSTGGAGFRGLMTVPGQPYVYALNDSPEGVYLFDLDLVEDNKTGDVIRDAFVGYLASARGLERDQALDTVTSAGPTGMTVTPDGSHLLVANFNANSVSIYDLRMGAYGEWVGEADLLGENPYMVRMSPDGRYAVVAMYVGEVETARVNSTLAVIDMDPESEQFMEVLTWIGNL